MPTLALIELTTPAMLGGLALLSLPFIAHLMNRRARKRIVFPTLLLLRASAATQSTLFRLRRWVVLLLRCLALALIALAFARPMWLDAKSAASPTNDEVAAVLLIDTSASTGQQTGGVTLVHELRSAALRTLDSLKSGSDTANIVYASATPRALFPRMSPNLPAIQTELDHLDSSFERASIPQAVSMAGELLATHNGRRQLVILSDLQQTNWQELTERNDFASLLPPQTQVTVIDMPTPAPANVGLSAPRYFPTQPLIGQATQLVVHVSNYANATRQVRVEVTVDGKTLANETVSMAAGEKRDVSFETTFDGTSGHEVMFEISSDGLAADNRAFLVVTTRSRIPVAIISDDDASEPGTASYFLTRALAPREERDSNHYEVRHVSSTKLNDAALADVSSVFVGYLGELGPAAAEALVNFVKRGGGVLFFCGEGQVRRNLQSLQQTAGNVGLVPWEPLPAGKAAGRDESLRITTGKWQSPLLREFDEQSQIVISQIQFKKLWSSGPIAPDADVLLTFSDGTPALAARQAGAGQFVLANFSPALSSSDLGKYGTFVALMQSLAKQLTPTVDLQSEAIVGRTYRHPQSFETGAGHGGVSATGPEGERIPMVVNVEANRISVQLQDTTRPGFYRFTQDNKPVGAAAINVDKREHNLERIDSSALMNQLQAGGAQLTIQSADDWEPLPDLHGRPLWGWFFAAAMAVVGLELLCLGVWKR